AAPNGPQFGRGGSLLRELPNGDIGAERLPDELRPGPILCLHRFLDLLCHRGGKRNGKGLSCSHGCYLVTPCLTSIAEEMAVSTPIWPRGRTDISIATIHHAG